MRSEAIRTSVWGSARFWTFVSVSAAAFVILGSLVLVPQYLAERARLASLRSHAAHVAETASSVLNGTQHRQLLDPQNYTPKLYAETLAPLVKLHSANPEIFYVYTMIDKPDGLYFVLDTATSRDLRTKHSLRASEYMERFETHADSPNAWVQQVKAGQTYVTPDFEQDDFGTFLTAHSPIHDERGIYSGFVGIDFDLGGYLAREARFRNIGIGTLIAAAILALLIGGLANRYHGELQKRMNLLYDASIRDPLTGLLNRRGAQDLIEPAMATQTGSSVCLVLDINNLKMLNDLEGHSVGDAVIISVADAVRANLRPQDWAARLGGDEFLIFAPDAGLKEARGIADGILTRLRSSSRVSNATVSFSLGLSLGSGPVKFTKAYEEADAVLLSRKAELKRERRIMRSLGASGEDSASFSETDATSPQQPSAMQGLPV